MSQIVYVSVNGTESSDNLTAGVTYNSGTDSYEVVSAISGAGGDDTLVCLQPPINIGGELVEFSTRSPPRFARGFL